jgi:hypothetical protein
MATLFRERGQVDLILTDPSSNTGRDWRYNDRWERDPNDPGLGARVEPDEGDRHTKWMRFMWPRLQMMKGMLKFEAMLDELFRREPPRDHQLAEKLRASKRQHPRVDRHRIRHDLRAE